MDLLRGLLDTDGTISKDRYQVSYTTTSPTLKDDIVELVRSLGYRAYVSTDGRDDYRSGVCYIIRIGCPDDEKPKLFLKNRKSCKRAKHAAKHYKTNSRYDLLTITKIEKIGKARQRCFLVDDPEHIFIAEDYVPTHNTYLLRHLIERYGFTKSNCMVMAYTGQAVNVLRQNGIMASTIHSSIMTPREEPILDPDTGNPIIRRGVPLTRVTFKPIKSLPKSIGLVVVDEASFLPESLEAVLKRYNVPILEIGDPIQLPPVADKQVFRMDNLDYFGEGVMRQHADSELYRFDTLLRQGKNVNLSEFHDEVLFLYAQPTIEETFHRFLPFFRNADVIITCTNKQRQVITDLYRRHIIKTNSPYPRKGERVICRKNNQTLMLDQYMLSNGTQGISMYDVGRSMIDKGTGIFYMDFKPDVVGGTDLYYDNLACDSEYLQKPFGSDNLLTTFRHPGEKFEYAHAITAHLSQGAQYRTVLFMDAFGGDPEYRARLRYTAATRAIERLIYVIPYSRYPGWCDLRTIENRNHR